MGAEYFLLLLSIFPTILLSFTSGVSLIRPPKEVHLYQSAIIISQCLPGKTLALLELHILGLPFFQVLARVRSCLRQLPLPRRIACSCARTPRPATGSPTLPLRASASSFPTVPPWTPAAPFASVEREHARWKLKTIVSKSRIKPYCSR